MPIRMDSTSVARCGFRSKRNTRAEILSGSCACYTTAVETGALTVAGQWRSFTAFPNILAIAMMSCAAARDRSSDVMETTSMTSTFIAGMAREVKVENRAAKNDEEAGRIDPRLNVVTPA